MPWRASWRILAGSWHWIAFAVEYRLPVVAGVGRVWIALHTRGGLDVITGLTLPAGGRAGDSCGHFHQRNLTASCTVRPDTPTAAAAWSRDCPLFASGKFALSNFPPCPPCCLSFAFTSNIGFSLIASVDFWLTDKCRRLRFHDTTSPAWCAWVCALGLGHDGGIRFDLATVAR